MSKKTRLVSLIDKLKANGWEPGLTAGWDDEDKERIYKIIANVHMKDSNRPLAAVAIELLSKNAPDTVRGVMYSVVSAGWLPDTSKKSYGQIQRLLNALRKKEVIPFDWIVDNIREMEKPSSWTGLADFADTVSESYRKDLWASLRDYVAIIVEKDTVAGRIAPVTQEYDVPLYPLRGYSSTSFVWNIARDWKKIKKPIHVYYVGDHDPSGRDIERSVIASLKEYGRDDFHWKRLGVNPDQFRQYNMIPLAAKKQDKRYKKFVDEFGEKCAEVEAIPAADLRGLVQDAIESHIPQDTWNRLKEIEQEERAQWQKIMKQLDPSRPEGEAA